MRRATPDLCHHPGAGEKRKHVFHQEKTLSVVVLLQMQKCDPVRLKTSATAASRLISSAAGSQSLLHLLGVLWTLNG